MCQSVDIFYKHRYIYTMRCPYCGGPDDKVLESRSLSGGSSVRRRRECLNCGGRFTSYERIEERPFMVIKRDGRREPFDRVKIERGLGVSVRKRPVSLMDIERLVNEIEDSVVFAAGNEREITSRVIGEMVLERLGVLDEVAYIRFASVCRHFENLDEFVKEIKKFGRKT